MSIYKRINPSDVSIKNFPLYKQWDVSYLSSSQEFSNNLNSLDVSDKIVLFRGEYQEYPISTILPEIVGFSSEPTTSLGITKRGIYDFIKGVYNKPIRMSNEFNYVLDDPINNLRELYQSANLVKIHQDIYGYKIKESSLQITSSANTSFYVVDGYVDDDYVDGSGNTVNFLDDGKGNLYDISYPETSFLDNQNRVIYLSFTKKYESYNNNGFLTLGLDTFRSGTINEVDESYFQNEYEITDVYYRDGVYGQLVDLISGSIKIPNDFGYNLDINKEFGISFILNPGLSASYSQSVSTVNILRKGYQTEQPDETIRMNNSYPYGISYNIISQSLEFSLSDGIRSFSVSSSINSVPFSSSTHVICQKTGSSLYIYLDSNSEVYSSSIGCIESCSNKSPIYIGSNPLNSLDKFKGTLEQISFFDNALTTTERNSIFNIPSNIWQLGKVIYTHGLIILTNPQEQYNRHLDPDNEIESLNIKYKSTKYLTELEYICRVKPHEYNYTYNKTIKEYKQLSCAEGSSNIYDDPNFNPYVTTIGLYNDNYDLLAIAKIASPIRIPPNHDLNFMVKFDI